MQLHLVGGFLGSGKTTAIAGAARFLLRENLRVGIITNDQGRYLVDTAFFRAADLPAVEVSGGCFCCHYDDLDARLDELIAATNPDVIFAESVGSCADLVATVLKPLLSLRQMPASLSVFADSRLLRQRWLDRPMPFADDVVYIFDQQIAEASQIVANKSDLLTPAEREELSALAAQRVPGQAFMLHSALQEGDVARWLATIRASETPALAPPLDIDYARYGAGEAALAWFDQKLSVQAAPEQGRQVARALVTAILDQINVHAAPIAHLKFLFEDGAQAAKLSFTRVEDQALDWQAAIPDLNGDRLQVQINARVQTGAETLRDVVHGAVDRVAAHMAIQVHEHDAAWFHPKMPRPTHRMA